MSSHFSVAEDLGGFALLSIAVVLTLWVLMLAFELVRLRSGRALVAVSGVFALLFVVLAVLRPVRVKTRANLVGPRVVVLVDRSRRLQLPEGNSTREARLHEVVGRLGKVFAGARLSFLGFGEGDPVPFSPEDRSPPQKDDSDLATALGALAHAPGERAQAVVVVSDGRLLRPAEGLADAELARLLGQVGVPVHAVGLARVAPPDAQVRAVQNAGVAVAHQPLSLRVDIACTGGLRCEDVPVTVRELRQGEEPAVLAEGVAKLQGKELATVDLEITLERAGARIVEVMIRSPEGDRVPDNDRRILTFTVTRDRVRLLHVAGRPTYDVRSLRMWLKSNESVDLVAFFILRTRQSNPLTTDDSELALIPFPVRDLFTEHLPSFDAVVLQDIDAVTYELAQYLPALERYVRSGGGIIMVGGPSAFAGGGYARSSLERVLPTEIGEPDRPFDLAEFVPRYTDAGRVAPVLGPVRDLVAEDLPRMLGSNTLGRAREGAIVLWEHPQRRVGSEPMPVLALGDAGDGRAISLAVDGTHQLAFSEFAERTAGRAYGALWDGLLGWLMRDPRYEAARIELVGPCVAGQSARLRLNCLPGTQGDVALEVEPLRGGTRDKITRTAKVPASGSVEIEAGPLAVGGYTARARVGQAPATRFDFACERGGSAWSDSRPDPERLARIARVSGGKYVDAERVADLPMPPPTEVAAQREVSPLMPPWVWALAAAGALGWHWIARRRAGLA
ncbi:MAG TPA: glutamine amidotransferase [Polyangiaceae bacterium]|nr:glutamine amidotransferase [Polyangiaceae bacterium]